MKKEKGITLVALVITIVVLLILAGVSISLLVGNNGQLKIVGDYSRAVIGKATKHSAEGKTYVLVK